MSHPRAPCRPTAAPVPSRQGWRRPALAVALLLSALCGPATATEPEAIALPSGHEVTLLDVITNVPGQGLTYRYRFLAPHIVSSPDPEATTIDMQFLCDAYALPRLSAVGPQPNQIVITLLDSPVPFGEISPEAIQFFEAYSLGVHSCEWENF